jgi:lipopolysaccharide transport system permease protein
MPSPTSSPTIPPEVPVVEIRARTGWVPLQLRELVEFRELLWFFLWRDLKGRYRQMALGPLWMVLQPLINTLLFTLIFSRVAKVPSDGLPYPLFTYSALLLWTFFTQCAETSSMSLIGYKHLIAKVYFPRLLVPLVGIFAALIEFLISFIILAGVFWFYGYSPGLGWLALPLLLVPTAMLGLSVGLWTATGVVHFRDVMQLISFGLRAAMYLSPVVYPSSLVPEQWRSLYQLNPLVPLLDTWRAVLFGLPTNWSSLLYPVLFSLPLLIAGAYIFRRAERNIVDIA